MRMFSDDQPEAPELTPEQPDPAVQAASRKRHEALAAIERETRALLGDRHRNLPRLFADLRALL